MRDLSLIRFFVVVGLLLFKSAVSFADEVSELKSRITNLEKRIEDMESELPVDKLNPTCKSKPGSSGYEVSREEGARLRANRPMLLRLLGAMPYYKHGITEGLRLFDIRPGSFFDRMGLCNHDIVTKVGDKSPRDLTELVSLLTQDEPPAPSELAVSIIRGRTRRILLVRKK